MFINNILIKFYTKLQEFDDIDVQYKNLFKKSYFVIDVLH